MKLYRINGELIGEGDTIKKLAEERKRNLQGAQLYYAYLRGADLRGADLQGATLPTGETWEEYLDETLPELITAEGRTVQEIIDSGAFDCCRTWFDKVKGVGCLMAETFGARCLKDIPLLHRPRAEQCIQFQDAYLLRDWPERWKAR